jgi:release factor glutamine methyltransferase
MKLFEAAQSLREQLREIYGEGEAAIIADLALEHITSLSVTQRLAKKEKELTEAQMAQVSRYSRRLQDHEPIQYLMNKSWFYGMELYVDRNVLIPRPETEELVDWIVQDVKSGGKDVFERRPAEADETKTLKILDVGTGSGCIALALKKAMPKAEVWGCDNSDEALNVARRNGSALNIRVDFQALNFLETAQQKQLPTVDIAVSNPPYIPQSGQAEMDPNVVRYEPHAALFVPDEDALVFYRALARFGKHRIYPNGCLYMEIHEDLGKEVVSLFRQEGYREIELRKDMQGKDRMIKVVNR